MIGWIWVPASEHNWGPWDVWECAACGMRSLSYRYAPVAPCCKRAPYRSDLRRELRELIRRNR